MDTLSRLIQRRKDSLDLGIMFIEKGDQEAFLSYHHLYYASLKALGALQERGIQPKDKLVFQVDDNRAFVIIYWACILGGIIPVPLAIGRNDDHRLKLFNVWQTLSNPFLIAEEEWINKLGDFAYEHHQAEGYAGMRGRWLDLDAVMRYTDEGCPINVEEDDVAFIQFSSGSTGSPKGVVVTHKNVMTNMADISAAARYTAADSMISWMPLTHDMGMIGFHLNPLYIGMRHYLMPTQLFVRRPELWLEKVTEHRVTILCSPNFGYRYLLKHLQGTALRAWDLSCVRLLYNGAEPISDKLGREFLESLSLYGLKRKAMCPVYGLAEASLAVSISDPDEEMISFNFDRDRLNPGDRVSVVSSEKNAVSFVNVGSAIDHCAIRIADENNCEMANEVVGHIQIKGENVTSGYYNNEAATREVIVEGNWLKTGDLGFIKDGSLYVTGRVKDIIFINGQNFYPHDIERMAEGVAGIELNKIMATGYHNDVRQREELVIFVFHRGVLAEFIPTVIALKAHLNVAMGLVVDTVIPVQEIPKTTSGKLQRSKLLDRYRRGDFAVIEQQVNDLLQMLPSSEDIVLAANAKEQKLADIWRTVLALEVVGVTQNFFELGGNSLKASEMAMAVSVQFCVEVSLDVIYSKPTIRALAEAIEYADHYTYEPLRLAPPAGGYVLSSSQKRLYYAWAMDKASIAYNMPLAFTISAVPDTSILENCIRQLIQRHDAFRMKFTMVLEPQFLISPSCDFSLETVCCSAVDLGVTLKKMVQPFDLFTGPLFRVKLVTLSEGGAVLFLDFHHIISDGVSVYYFLEGLCALYAGQTYAAPEYGYREYVDWESRHLRTPLLDDQKAYWHQRLSLPLPLLDLPLDYPRPAIQDMRGGKMEFVFDKNTTFQLNALALQYGCTLHALMFTCYRVLLFKYTQQDDIVIGIPVAGRRHPAIQRMQGMFVNNLAIRSEMRGDESFAALLKATKIDLQEALANQDYPFEKLITEIAGRRDMSRSPIFDTMFIYQNMGFPSMGKDDFVLTPYFFDPGFSKFDISLEVFDHEKSLRYAFEYSTALFKQETILQMQRHFDHLVKVIINDPGKRLSEISILSADELALYVCAFNNTAVAYPRDKCIHELFEETVRRAPDAVAVECNGIATTYDQLNTCASELALELRRNGVGVGSVVAIFSPRTTDLIIAIVGVLKAGGCYLPLDADLPAGRLHYILGHSGCGVVLTTTTLAEKVLTLPQMDSGVSPLIINLDGRHGQFSEEHHVDNINTPTDLAYIIYTSGTTGKPKGVMVEHRSLVNYVWWAADVYVKGEQVSFPLYTSISFDLTLTSIFTPLLTGNRIVIYPEDSHALLIDQVIADNKVNIVKATPSHLKVINASGVCIPQPCTIKKFIVGGEDLEQRLAEDIYRRFGKDVEIFNEYGPTEATIGCMIYRFVSGEGLATVPIGTPANNTRIYLLDRFLRPVPRGVIGELYIGGHGLARGYLFHEAMTDEKFIIDPFVAGEKMYKTGDAAKRLVNGNIVFIGRTDQQVKINGYRIELYEIENCLHEHMSVSRALVTVKTNEKGNTVLCAYIIAHAGHEVDKDVLRDYLASQLPHYMVPAAFVAIDNIPLTKNGKIDYHLLPAPATTVPAGNTHFLSDTEWTVAKIWCNVLGVNELSANDNFFALGGDSIKATQISSRLFEAGISLSVKDILTYPTVVQSSLRASVSEQSVYAQGAIEGSKALTPIDLWFFSHGFKNVNFYNQSVMLRFNRNVNRGYLEYAFRKVIAHHDGLRLRYDQVNHNMVYCSQHEDRYFVIDEYTARDNDERRNICQAIKQQIKLGEGPLIKAAIIDGDDTGDMLFITAHHLVMDGVSWRILLSDIYTVYTALMNGSAVSLPRKTASLIDWYRELVRYSQSEEIRLTQDYWRSVNETAFSVPQDYDTEDWTCKNLARESGSLNKAQTEFLLQGAHQVYQADVPILLNVALALTLKEWTGFETFVVEQESHGRHVPEVDASRTVGWFTALYPVRLTLRNDHLTAQIKSIKEQIRGIPSSGMGYGVGKYLLGWPIEAVSSRVDIRFNYLGQFGSEVNNDLFSFMSTDHGIETDVENVMTAKIEMVLMVMEGVLHIDIHYNAKAHAVSTIRWIKETYLRYLAGLLEHAGNEGDIHFTPSDFGLTGIKQEELDALFQ